MEHFLYEVVDSDGVPTFTNNRPDFMIVGNAVYIRFYNTIPGHKEKVLVGCFKDPRTMVLLMGAQVVETESFLLLNVPQ